MPVTLTLSPLSLKTLAEYRDSSAEMHRLIMLARATEAAGHPADLAQKLQAECARCTKLEAALAAYILTEANSQDLPGFGRNAAITSPEAVCH